MKKKPSTLQELFLDPSKWTKGCYMRDRKGAPTSDPDEACSYCLYGGIELVYGEMFMGASKGVISKMLDVLLETTPYYGIAKFNDDPSTTIKDIQGLVKKANV